MAVNPVAPVPTSTLNDNWFPLQLTPENDELFRPSSQVSNCRAEIIGTPWAVRRGEQLVVVERLRIVGVHVRRERAVVAERPEGVVEQGVEVERVGLPDSSVIWVAAW